MIETSSPITGFSPPEVWPIRYEGGPVVWFGHLRWNTGVMYTLTEMAWLSMAERIDDTTPPHTAAGIRAMVAEIKEAKEKTG